MKTIRAARVREAMRQVGGVAHLPDVPAGAGPASTKVQAAEPAQPASQAPALDEARVRQIATEREAMLVERLDSLQRQIDLMAAEIALLRRPKQWKMSATYLADGRIDDLTATQVLATLQ